MNWGEGGEEGHEAMINLTVKGWKQPFYYFHLG